MIDELHAQNIALIKDASISFAPGLTVLTGETGAGKTALLSALKLLVGERADSSSVREGEDSLSVEGRVFRGAQDSDGMVVRRRLGVDGRGRVEIDGHMASVHELAETVGASVDLCGQHEHQRLMSSVSHVEMLDAWAADSIVSARETYRDALLRAEEAAKELEHIREMSRASSERLDEARFILARIDEVNPQAGEYEELQEALPRAEHAGALLSAIEEVRELAVGEDSASDKLSAALSSLRSASTIDSSLESYLHSLESSLIDIEDVAASLREYRDTVELDPDELVRMQGRMSSLQGLIRSYGPSIEDVFARRVSAEELIVAAGEGGERLRAAEAAYARAEEELAAAASLLSERRRSAAPGLAEAVTHQMRRLEMGTASLDVSFEELPREAWSSSGPERMEFLFRPGEGMTPQALRRIASGGEISRVMLAAKVVLGEADEVDTLVFDEVDAGVGGATAVALASVIANLAKTHQVIVVTHLAQVAVVADRHYVVERTNGPVPETSLRLLEEEDRVGEIARMLSGDASAASLEHAREMLTEYGQASS